ncbi:hypothetical protein PM082_014382 [Marasmius tenuissimus]|nr:hypothetical protein PM082_014382 [Marasmius tenuissimus]
MASTLRWQNPEGLDLLKKLVSTAIPSWTNGLRPFQQAAIPKILDGDNVLCCTATGGGKSALFIIPILVHLHARNGTVFQGRTVKNIRDKPVGVVVTPTKGLAGNLVTELAKFGLESYAFTHKNLTKARRTHQDIIKEIAMCKEYCVIFVDPEHLKTKEWRTLAADKTFSKNLVYACAEEAHLINEWGAAFRKDFRSIGKFFRGRLSSNISVFAITAILAPGEATTSVCKSLGFTTGSFHLIQHSNKRPNMQITMKPLTASISGSTFPDLLPILSSGRKAVIHCDTLDLVFRVFVYLMSLYPKTATSYAVYNPIPAFAQTSSISVHYISSKMILTVRL